MNLLKVTCTILAVLTGIVVLCLGVIWLEKRAPGGDMDERQRQAQGRASGFAMVLGMLYFFVVVLLLLQQVDGPVQGDADRTCQRAAQQAEYGSQTEGFAYSFDFFGHPLTAFLDFLS